MQLRDYQQDLFQRIYGAIREGVRCPLVVSATGSGKTATFCYIAHRANQAGNECLILVHRRELITQTSATLGKFQVPHGIVQPGMTPDPTQRVQLAMVQTIARRIGSIKEPKLIIVDEAHHSVAGQYKAIIAAFPRAVVIGFTATPLRLDGKGLKDHFQRIIAGPSVEWLMENNHLCRPVYYAPPFTASLKGVKKRAGDFAADQLSQAMDSRSITGDAVAHYQKICPFARAVVFCVNIAHAEHVRDQFAASGISAAVIKGDMDNVSRKQVVDDLTTGKVMVMVSVDVVSEGFDLPSVEAAILLRPTTSLGLYLQQIGRILRPADGKTAYVLDHAGNIHRHGFAEDLREWTLEGVEKQANKSERATHKQCEACFCMYPIGLTECPECGHAPKPKPIEIEQVDGELIELKSGPLATKLAECKTRDDLKKLAKARGYKPGFVWYKAKELNLK